MSKSMIEIKNVSKKYKLRHAERYLALRDKLSGYITKPFDLLRGKRAGNPSIEDFYALKDISFDVKKGEMVGIIGRNGAGKTTLLKVISRITYPSQGQIRLYGRVASLLEVGTGFHPELSGRENIYFNGSILGMRKREIDKKFDEIVTFAEVGKFIDTPVKRYSSGMQVRLAFAVAAHLEPEILLIDEVLSVGDIAFQKKSLGKMENVAGQGRTVLFVSHNMGAVLRLCSRAILLSNGSIKKDGNVNSVVEEYMRYGLSQEGERVWKDHNSAPGNDVVRLKRVRLLDEHSNVRMEFNISESIAIEIEYEVLKPGYPLNTIFSFMDETGVTRFVSIDNLDSPWKDTSRPVGIYKCACHIPGDFMNEGATRVSVAVVTSPRSLHAREFDAVTFKVNDDMSCRGVRGNYPREWPQAVVRPRLHWDVTLLNK